MKPKHLTNAQIAELLRDVAASYQLKNSKKYFFQIAAYERAADAVEHSTSELKDLWDDGKLEEVPGIGPGIAKYLSELFKTGKSKHFDELMKGIPPEAFKLMELPGVGIKTAMKMIEEGNRKEIDEKLKEVEEKNKERKRYILPYAEEIARELTDYLLKHPEVVRVDPLGSLRRRVSTIGDIDVLVGAKNSRNQESQNSEIIKYFTEYPKAQKVIEAGDRTASILLPGDIQVDLMVMDEDSYGSALQHFTGSKHHNIALREYALKKGLSLSEYGIKKLQKNSSKLQTFKNEKSFYKFLGLDYIEPELREDTGEIEAALKHKLPNLVELADVKGDLQIHSSFDIETSHDLGLNSMEDVIKKAGELGYEYLAFTEHNPSQSGHVERDIMEILKKKREKVDQINYSLKKLNRKGIQKVFNSLEIDMKSDGSLPVPDKGMETLDFALVSIHSNFGLEKDAQTKRVLTALSHPKAKIFAHPTARKLNEREGVELNWPEIFDFAVKNNKWIEINCDPMRLDLPDILVREAVKLGVKMTFGTDAHSAQGLNNMVFGVSVARRGWCEKKDIVNTLNLKEFEEELGK